MLPVTSKRKISKKSRLCLGWEAIIQIISHALKEKDYILFYTGSDLICPLCHNSHQKNCLPYILQYKGEEFKTVRIGKWTLLMCPKQIITNTNLYFISKIFPAQIVKAQKLCKVLLKNYSHIFSSQGPYRETVSKVTPEIPYRLKHFWVVITAKLGKGTVAWWVRSLPMTQASHMGTDGSSSCSTSILAHC